ncbi:unnamed protein product [Brassicogethes aeneus]|uniref:Uncharacterized protein n=1 Tax=Brassicogethes aeneus TaxID=1431903 RepID=A0A9P0B7Y5_BRAAE|nr:unnamed protein product [Brassicogethes aeneus]
MRIVKCINEIQRSIRCAKLIEDIFSITYLIQYVILTGILTGVLYTLLLLDTVLEYIVFGTILSLILLDPFCLCWFSQSFSEDLLKLIPVIFQMDWKNYPPYLRRKLVFMMARLEKPVTLTLGNMIKVNLQFYVNVSLM